MRFNNPVLPEIARTFHEPRAIGAQAKYRTNILQLFSRYFERQGECLVWTGATNQFGYGQACITMADGKVKILGIHRLAYEFSTGEPPPPKGDKVLMHSCDNRRCFEPAHLSLGTYAENNADCRAKGRHPNARQVVRRELPIFQRAADVTPAPDPQSNTATCK